MEIKLLKKRICETTVSNNSPQRVKWLSSATFNAPTNFPFTGLILHFITFRMLKILKRIYLSNFSLHSFFYNLAERITVEPV